MITYTPEFNAMRKRWIRALVVPCLATILGIYLFSAWGTHRIPTLGDGWSFVQPFLDVLPLALFIGGVGGGLIQTFRKYRCPACGRLIERGNKGACRGCGISFGYWS